MPPDAPAAPPAPAAEKTTVGSMFADMITAPPKQEELAPGQTMPESTPPPAAPPPPPAAPPAPPPKSDTPQLEKQETPKLEVPPKTAATQTKKEEPKTEAAAEKDEELDLPEEEFEARLAGMNKSDAHKLARRAFKQRTFFQQRGDKLEKDAKKVVEAEKKVIELEKKIIDLQEAPETKANLARIEKAEADLKKANEDLAGREAKLEEGRKYVDGLQLAHDVRKTPEWAQYVESPSNELINDIHMLAVGIGANEDQTHEIEEGIKAALRIAGDDQRWKALKEAGAELSPADQARLADIFKAHKIIARNRDFLTGKSDEARKALEESRTRAEADKKNARTKEFNDGAVAGREAFAKDLPWVNDNFDQSKYPENFKAVIADAKSFADKMLTLDMTPAQEAKMRVGYAYYQGSTILAKMYAVALENENIELRKNLEELTKFKADTEAAAVAAEQKKEEEKGSLTPSSAPRRPANSSPAPRNPPPQAGRGNGAPAIIERPRTAGEGFAKLVVAPPNP